MDNVHSIGTHMISMCTSLIILKLDEVEGKICTAFHHGNNDTITDARTTKIRYDKAGDAYVERFRNKYYLSDFIRADAFNMIGG